MMLRQAFDLALRHHREGRLDLAEGIYVQILSQEPNDPDAWQLLGLIAHDRGRHEEAVASIGRAIALNPSVAAYHSNLGVALWGAGRHAEAVAAYRTAVGLDPDFADASYNLGDALRDQGLHEAAVDAYRRALRREPRMVEAQVNLGVALRELGRLDEAVAAYEEAIRLEPDCAEAHSHLGFARALQGCPDQALECYRRATALDPNRAAYQSQLLQTLHYHPGYDAAAIRAEHVRWGRQLAGRLGRSIRPHENDRDPDRRLRIGYVSADFHHHACSFYLEHLLAAHDPARFEVACYAEVARPDEVTRRCQAHARLWRNTVGVSDDQLAELIRGDAIDILVDLKVHTAENRLPVFARRPAPVQVTWLGYPGTTGLDTIDYRLSDPYLDPPGLNDFYYTEETIRLADTFWCYEPGSREPAVNPLPALGSGSVTFGSTNNFCKVNDPVLELWARVLCAVPGARLLILTDAGSHRQRVLGILERNGVEPRRVEFEPRRARPSYLELYHRIDIALDTFPYSGATTSLDALWMGVPVACWAGRTAVSRGGLTILFNLGLPELVAHGPDEYVAIAARLAGDLKHLAELRATLRRRLENSPMMDTQRFALQIERAYRAMWRRWCAGERPRPDARRPAAPARHGVAAPGT
jgi:predicted O-linked N-acetylglucosamine transferase (SPINDLY family)